ncbi:MAG: pyruvate kinase [Parcubacteria bacterium C7867-003]|nr:MAG: pyruvate kinase [Parcubacteria bacterium C7867-003]
MKKTKIVATIGPKTESEEMLAKMLNAGMDVMRLNFSHGDFAEHQNRVDNLRKVIKKTGQSVAILQDLGGPKIRIGSFKTDEVILKVGQTFTLTTDDILGDETIVSVNYLLLPKEVKKGHIIFMHDGKKKLEVKEVKGKKVICKVLVGGEIKGRRGLNMPDSDLTVKSLTEKDLKDLEFGIKNDVDFIALSFVRRPSDIAELRKILDKRKSKAGIIAKIETPQAVSNIDEIISLCDGIMIARGDLAIEVPYEKVPGLQKMMIRKCNDAGKPVITATQMMESMIKSSVATRAEVSDVANAILDGTDAVMLSEESTLGDYPIEAVTVMRTIAKEMEKDYPERAIVRVGEKGETKVSDSVTSSVVKTAHDVGARVIVALTDSGFTARMVSRHKPHANILALSPNNHTSNKLNLSYGCIPVTVPLYNTIEDVIKIVKEHCLKEKLVKKGDKVVIAAGVPFNTKGLSTNMLLVQSI